MNTDAQLACAFVLAQELSSHETAETISEELFKEMTELTGGFAEGPDLPELHDAGASKPRSLVRPDLERVGDSKLLQWTRCI